MKLPSDVRQLLLRRFESRHRDWLGAGDCAEHWPLAIALGMPSEQAALKQVDAVRSWAAAWREWQGAGELAWSERRWKVLGTQRLPESLTLSDAAQAAQWIGELERWQRATQRFAVLAARWPELAARLPRWFGVLADYGDADFERLADMLGWLQANPASGLYPRQIPLAGIDSKWMETRKGLLSDLAGALRAPACDGGDVYQVCGLKRPPVLLRMRVLDPALRARLGGLGDITAPVDEIARLELPAANVLIVENLQTGLALADVPGTVAFMALGYGVDLLAQVRWIARARCIYWGDIDTHGFAILHQARSCLPEVTSLLMDEPTLLRFQDLWAAEPAQHSTAELALLTVPENAVYSALKQGRWGHNLRLEQERIAWDHAWPEIVRVLTGADRHIVD